MSKEKIKKILTASIVLVLFSVNVNAQDANTGAVTLNVRLHPIQTLIINPDQKVVDLDYVTKDDYANGVQVTKNDHLQVYSTGGFEVKVKASGSELTGTSNTIAANTIGITASQGSQALEAAAYESTSLSSEDQLLIESNTGGVDKTFNVSYDGAGADEYVNHYYDSENPTVYTTTVTYTISAK